MDAEKYTVKWLFAFMVAALAVLTIALAPACGRGSTGKHAVVQPFRAGESELSTRAKALDYQTDGSIDDALGELEELQCPEGVDEKLWGKLKEALNDALTERTASKVVSAPPTGEANRVNDLTLADHYDGTYTLRWRYRNLGDYDQNGEVGISDITPLAIHFGEEVPGGDAERNSLQAVIDGSGDGVISIADVTPIAINFGTCCAGYSIRSATSSPESIEETVEIDKAPITLAEGEDRKIFRVEPTLSPLTYIAVVPYDTDETLGELSNVVMIANHSPVARLIADPMEGHVPLTVDFDASGSYDRDGSIVSYEWDFDGDGSYDGTGTRPPTEPRSSHTYEEAGDYVAVLRVTDDYGANDTAQAVITVFIENQPPVAHLTANPTWGNVRLPVSFRALESHDPDGTIVKYEWDCNGDGWFDDDPGTSATYSYTYRNRGVYQAAVRVTDDDSASATASVTITVEGGQWVHTWGLSDVDYGNALTVDGGGNIYVTGEVDSEGLRDIPVLKYDANGNLVWAIRWGGDHNDWAYDIKASEDGSLYIAGATKSFGIPIDGLILKFDSSGTFQWARTWGGENTDKIRGLAVADNGDIYAVGETCSFDTMGEHNVEDVLVLKYDAAGNLLWARTWGNSEVTETVTDAVVDTDGNLYMVGSMRPGEKSDVLLLKFNPEGGLIWPKAWSGSTAEQGHGVTIDRDGNLLVSGVNDAHGMGDIDALLIKLDPDGNVIWQKAWGTDCGEDANSLAVDSWGNIYLGAGTYPGSALRWEVVLLQIDADGQLVGQQQWGGPGEQKGLDLAIGSGALYISGYAPDICGEYQDASLEPASCEGSILYLPGLATEPEGFETSPTGTITFPEAVLDEGGGEDDILVMEFFI